MGNPYPTLDSIVRIYDTSSASDRASAGASATSCHFPSGSSSCAVTASIDGCVKIWDVKTARALAQPEGTGTITSLILHMVALESGSHRMLFRERSAYSVRLLYKKLASS